MAPSETDYYKILGLGRHATDDDIKRSFRKLARDTHPDKNPNDPTAKERFQELQRAYDTLKDNLERSKYDEDNPYHGIERSSSSTYRTHQNGTRSGTAKRYTAGSSAHTPGWANGGAPRGYDGFAQQASAAKPKPWAGSYNPYDEWESGKTPSGFTYQTGGYHRPPPAAKPPAAEYEDGYYKTKRESAYARTSAQRPHPTSTAKQHPQHTGTSSASPRPKSTTGNRYASASATATPAKFDVADYIREKKAKEEEEKRKQDEEQRTKDRLRREAEELKRQEEERHRKSRDAKDKERRRAEEAEAMRNPYSETSGFGTHSTSNGYSYAYPPETPSPYASRKEDDDLLREAEEKMKERGKPAANPYLSSTHSRRNSKPSMKSTPTPAPKWPKGHPLYTTYEVPEDWKHDKSRPDDIDVVEVTPTETHHGKRQEIPKDYFPKFAQTGPEYVRKDGTGVYPAPPPFKVPAQEKSTPSKAHPDRTPSGPYGLKSDSSSASPKKPKGTARRQSSSEKSQEAHKENQEAHKQNQSKPAYNVPAYNVFAFQETAPPPDEKPSFNKPFDFSFAGSNSRPFGSFTSNNSPELQEKAASSGSGAHLRPRSQPTHTQPPFAPSPSAPPNLQQQQKAAATAANSNAEAKGEDFKFKRGLYEDLLKQAAFTFLPTNTSSTSSTARKKRSAPSLSKKKSHTIRRTGSKEAKLNNQPRVESDGDSDNEIKTSPPMASNGFGYEPMDAEPTGVPKTIPMPAPVPENGTPKSPTENRRKSQGLDVSGIGAVPPLSRSPADVGLGGLESLKDSLPFPSKASAKPPLASRMGNLRMNPPSTSPSGSDPFVFSIPPDFWNLYPQTPLEQPFLVPKAPLVPKIPKVVSLDHYNRFYNSLGSYIEAWNRYEAEVHALRADLTSKSMHVSTTQTFDTQDIVKYMERVKNKDAVLDHSFTRARDRHLAALDMWVKLRESVLKHQEQH